MEAAPNVRFGLQVDICSANSHVCFTPNSDRESEIPQKAMSALAPKADMCSARGYVRLPKADINSLFDHLIRTRLQCRRHAKAERLGGLEVYDQLDFSGLLDW